MKTSKIINEETMKKRFLWFSINSFDVKLWRKTLIYWKPRTQKQRNFKYLRPKEKIESMASMVESNLHNLKLNPFLYHFHGLVFYSKRCCWAANYLKIRQSMRHQIFLSHLSTKPQNICSNENFSNECLAKFLLVVSQKPPQKFPLSKENFETIL